MNLKDRYRKSRRERCRDTENLKREWETETVRDTETVQGHIEPQKQIPEVAERHREPEKRM